MEDPTILNESLHYVIVVGRSWGRDNHPKIGWNTYSLNVFRKDGRVQTISRKDIAKFKKRNQENDFLYVKEEL